MSVYPWCAKEQKPWEKCTAPLLHKDSKKHRADFYLGGLHGDRIRKNFDKREDALDYERTTITRYKDGQLHPNTVGEHRTFGEACDHYIEAHLLPNKQFHDLSRVKMYRKFFGENTLLMRIDGERCKEMFSALAGRLQPASVVRMWTLLISIFRENRKWCPNNPAKGVIPRLYRKKANKPKTTYFTDEEYPILLKHCQDINQEDIVVIFRNTGFRTGDGENFQVEHCDFTTNTIHIPEQKNQEAGSIPMVPEARKRILEIMKRKNISSGYILDMTNAGKRFTRLCKRAGLYKPYPHNKTLHSLRHSWGTYVQKNYKDIRVTQLLMRHKDIKMTTRYAHAANELLKSAALAGSAPSVAPGMVEKEKENVGPLSNL